MDFTKYVSLLSNRAIFFPRAEKLAELDPFECSRTAPTIEAERRRLSEAGVPLDQIQQIESTGFRKMVMSQLAFSCWHMNEHESAAMWKLYLKSDEGIAVRSSYKRLCNSFADFKHSVYVGVVKYLVGVVKYLDFERDYHEDGNLLSPGLCKRASFAHERELRAVIWNRPGTPEEVRTGESGLSVPVNLDELIEAVHVAPGSEKWYCELVQSVTDKYSLDRKIRQSAMDAAPLY